jgi:hypothetical protein
MIVGIQLAPFNVIRILNISSFRFYITGSRYFGYAQPDADWDFFTQDKEGIADYLKSKGFKRIGMDPKWLGTECLGIYRNDQAQVEVAVQKDWLKKHRAQEFIRRNPATIEKLRSLHKFDRGQVWDEVYTFI